MQDVDRFYGFQTKGSNISQYSSKVRKITVPEFIEPLSLRGVTRHIERIKEEVHVVFPFNLNPSKDISVV